MPVSFLDLRGNVLQQISLFTLPRGLSYLLLGSNKLTGISASDFSIFKAMRNLDITDNLLGGPLSISDFPLTLETLAVSGNAFTGPLDLTTTNALSVIYAQNTGFTSLSFPQNGTTLSALYASNSKISGSLSSFGNFSGIDYLDLSGNLLTGPLPYPFFWPSLYAAFNSNQLTGQIVIDPTESQFIDLSDNPFSGTPNFISGSSWCDAGLNMNNTKICGTFSTSCQVILPSRCRHGSGLKYICPAC
jgi:hypothetical protein